MGTGRASHRAAMEALTEPALVPFTSSKLSCSGSLSSGVVQGKRSPPPGCGELFQPPNQTELHSSHNVATTAAAKIQQSLPDHAATRILR